MLQLLRLIGDTGSLVGLFDKSTDFDTIKHWSPYLEVLLTEKNMEVLFISFYYWSQTMSLHKINLSPFYVLQIVYKCFVNRFFKALQTRKVLMFLFISLHYTTFNIYQYLIYKINDGIRKSQGLPLSILNIY